MSRKQYARQFYPGDCKAQIEHFLKNYKVPQEPVVAVGGIVPHAGWVYSGAVAAKVFKCLSLKANPDTFILLGAVHTWKPRGNSIYSSGSWTTPLGDVKIDEDVANELIDFLAGDIIEAPDAHEGEHSLEVQLPFIKYFCPDAKIVPIAIPPDKNAHMTGEKIGKAVSGMGKKIVVVGTTDLTHYGDAYGFTPFGYGETAKRQMEESDARIIKLALMMRYDEIVREALKNQNACGSGALAATVAAVNAMGANKGYLLQYTTSYDVMQDGAFEMAVGYGGLLF
ncbi:MAG: AmmeMemoRadiSam system protein B [Syntrophaceae bacterium]|nr:AmmeMemoRadiSam system protein B [Syntrophaceae bacterium]